MLKRFLLLWPTLEAIYRSFSSLAHFPLELFVLLARKFRQDAAAASIIHLDDAKGGS